MPQRFRVDDEHRPLRVGAGFHIRPESLRRPLPSPGEQCLPLQTVSHCVHSSLISQPIILQPPLQFRLVGYKNALLQG